MSPEKKYLIKYFGDVSKKNLYWFKDKEEWTGDWFQATQFNNPEGITEVGRLLVEHEWVTRLIQTEEIQMLKPVSPPSEDFILVVDCDGDPQEVFSGNTNLDQVFQLIDKLDRESGYHPHSAWRRSAGGFTRVFERIGKDPRIKPENLCIISTHSKSIMKPEELGRDTNGGISSLPTIHSGKNRGFRKPEVGGNWLCTGGYTTDSLGCEKNAHGSWLNSMQKLGFRTGRYDVDGVVNLYVFKEFHNSVK